MKRLLVALVLLLTVVVLCVVSLNLQSNSIDSLIDLIEKMQQAYDKGDLGEAQEVAYKFVDEFDTQTRYFPFFMHHSDVNKVEESVVVLPILLETGNYDEFAVELAKCRSELELLDELETPIPENIL